MTGFYPLRPFVHLARLLLPIIAMAAWSPPASADVQPAGEMDPAVWSAAADGAIVHKPTGAVFPASYGIFKRAGVTAIAADGSDAAIRYDAENDGSHIRLSVFLFRPHGDDPELKGALTAIAARSPDAYVWADGPFNIPAPQNAPIPLRAFKGVYKTGEGPRAVLDYLYLAELGTWSFKVRATIAPVRAPAQEEAIDLVVRSLPWEAVLKANGQCDGRACRTGGAIPFDSHVMESLLPNLLLKTTKFDPSAERDLPVVGRAATPPLGDAIIRRSGKDPVVYVTAIEGLGTFRLVKLPDMLKKMTEGAFGRLSIEAPLYGVAIDSEGSVLMPRLFTGGEPTPAEFGAVVSELVLHSTASPFVTVRETAAALPGGK